MKRALNPPRMAPPLGPYSLVTEAPAGGRLVFCSGAIALDGDGAVVGRGDMRAQTRQVMENLAVALESAGARFDDVVKITTYVTDVSRYADLAAVRAEYLREPYPASTMVEVAGLMLSELLVEIEAVAVVHDDRA